MKNLVHNYYDAGYSKTVEIILQGGEDEHIVKFNDIIGIKEIDLSGM